MSGSRLFEHVFCVYPYRRKLSAVGFFPPVGLECIATVIEPHTRTLEIVDLRKEAGHTKDFLRPDADLVCFSLNWDRDAEFLREEIRSVPPKIFTLVGGRHATVDPEHWLIDCPNIDAVVRGDGEEATEELCRGVPLEKIAGLSFRRDGQIVYNPILYEARPVKLKIRLIGSIPPTSSLGRRLSPHKPYWYNTV